MVEELIKSSDSLQIRRKLLKTKTTQHSALTQTRSSLSIGARKRNKKMFSKLKEK